MVGEDDRLMIYAPVIMNAEVMISKEAPETVRHLGIGQQRKHLETLAREKYPQIETISELSPRTLPYSLTEGQIDGAIMDVTKASLLSGFQTSPISKDDYISYVLVIRKELLGTVRFERFLQSYQAAVDRLQDREALRAEMGFASNLTFLYFDEPLI